MQHWKILDSRYVLQSPYMNLRQDTCQLPEGQVVDDYYVVEHQDVAMVVGLTAQQNIILVEQYKHAIGGVCMELPAGLFEGDNPSAEARREFEEETGYTAAHFEPLSTLSVNPTRNEQPCASLSRAGCVPKRRTTIRCQ